MPRDENRSGTDSSGAGAGAGGGAGAGARGGCGAAALWVRRWWRALVAELVATALLMVFGIGSALSARSLLEPAMGFGCVVAGNCVAFGPASGAHMNPAVTLAALLQRRLGWREAGAYVAAQVAGALLGFGLLALVAPATSLPPALPAAGCTALAPGVAPLAGALLEALLTGSLVLACCALWEAHDDARPDHAAPLKLGLLVAGLVFAGGAMTGASLNPARSLAPALLRDFWTHHWVYWAGPLAGAALAALLHRGVLAPRRAAAPAAPAALSPEEMPLNDKV